MIQSTSQLAVFGAPACGKTAAIAGLLASSSAVSAPFERAPWLSRSGACPEQTLAWRNRTLRVAERALGRPGLPLPTHGLWVVAADTVELTAAEADTVRLYRASGVAVRALLNRIECLDDVARLEALVRRIEEIVATPPLRGSALQMFNAADDRSPGRALARSILDWATTPGAPEA